jgi:hypothetical protein
MAVAGESGVGMAVAVDHGGQEQEPFAGVDVGHHMSVSCPKRSPRNRRQIKVPVKPRDVHFEFAAGSSEIAEEDLMQG